MEKSKDLVIRSCGTSNGRSVVWAYDEKGHEYEIPTDLVTMSKLAEVGVRIRNVNDAKPRRLKR